MEYVGTLYGKIARLEAEVKRLREQLAPDTHEEFVHTMYCKIDDLQSQLSDKDNQFRNFIRANHLTAKWEEFIKPTQDK